MDWDKIRIFLNVAEAGSFTRAGDDIGLSQSAVSRQISALERELKAPLFHRHARGLILTEQGDLLFRAARDMKLRLENTRARLVETSERPSGDLKVTTTTGLGTSWLAQRVAEFLDLYPMSASSSSSPTRNSIWPCARPTSRFGCGAPPNRT